MSRLLAGGKVQKAQGDWFEPGYQGPTISGGFDGNIVQNIAGMRKVIGRI